MRQFKKFLYEVSAQGNKMPISKTSLEDAMRYVRQNLPNWDSEIPMFAENYRAAKKKCVIGDKERSEMPVIGRKFVKEFQQRLKNGMIDVNAPFSSAKNAKNPYPEGLDGEEAREWLQLGHMDGDLKDDVINTSIEKIPAEDLFPIQKQVYFDKVINGFIKNGIESEREFFKSALIVASRDGFIIDGHHRFLGAMILNPSMRLNVLKVDMEIDELYKLALAYGDAIGSKRNK